MDVVQVVIQKYGIKIINLMNMYAHFIIIIMLGLNIWIKNILSVVE